MDGEDFLVGLKFTNKVSAAIKVKAQDVLIGKNSDTATLQKSIDKVKSDFIADWLPSSAIYWVAFFNSLTSIPILLKSW